MEQEKLKQCKNWIQKRLIRKEINGDNFLNEEFVGIYCKACKQEILKKYKNLIHKTIDKKGTIK